MFADICGSSALYDSLGDALARRLIAKCIDLMLVNVTANQGKLIKTIGDEIMCTFHSAEKAMHAACAIQKTVDNNNLHASHPMHIRIGFHYGEVICEADDVYGDTVNVAARIAAITRANQIMTTKAVADSLPPDLRDKTYKIMRAVLKGKEEQLDIFQVTWDADAVQRTRVGTPTFRKPQEGESELILSYRGQSFNINEQHSSAVLGHEEGCDILVANDFSSRQHARIEFRFGKFVIADQSTYGTYISFLDGHSVHLAREELVLHNSGYIGLGQPNLASSSDTVEFAISSG